MRPTTLGGLPTAIGGSCAPVAIVVGAILFVLDGGETAAWWYPAAVLLCVMVGIGQVVGVPAAPTVKAPLRVLLVVWTAFCTWAALSTLWAASPGDALDGTNRAVLYGFALALGATPAGSRRVAAVTPRLLVLGASAIAIGVLLVAGSKAGATSVLRFGRLSEPTGYANATACYFTLAAWPAIHLAACRPVNWALRGAWLAAACLLLELAVLSQSRGALLAFAAATVLYLLLVDERLPAAAAITAVVVVVTAAWPRLTAVWQDARAGGSVDDALGDARLVIAATCAGAFALGACASWVSSARCERRDADGGPAALRTRDPRRRLVLLGTVVLAAAALVAAAAVSGWLSDRWDDFKGGGYARVESGSSRFNGALGSNRYDFYRVALDGFRDRPIGGLGADNFAALYLRERRSEEAPDSPHSVVVQQVAELGVVGGTLFAGFLVAAGWAVTRARRVARPSDRGLVAASAAGFATWLVQSSADRLWDFPALAVTAFALLGLTLSIGGTGAGAAPRRGTRRGRLALALLTGLLSLPLAVSSVGATLTASGYAVAEREPQTAMRRFGEAARWVPLSAEPLIARGLVARGTGHLRIARSSFVEAIRRERGNWLPHAGLALVDIRERRPDSGRREAQIAASLNPGLGALRQLVEALQAGRRVDPDAVAAAFGYEPARSTARVLERLNPA